MSAVRDAYETLRQPEYTGENRCIPCTVVNALIAVVVAAALWALVTPAVGVVALAVCVAAIGLRGYLVPGTPTLTKRYFPGWVLAWFDKRPENTTVGAGEGAEAAEDIDAATELFAAGAIEECDGDDFCLNESFRETWLSHADAIDGREELATSAARYFDLDADDEVTFEPLGPSFTVLVNGTKWGDYPSEAAFLAEVAGAEVLSSHHDRWDSFALAAQSELLAALRLFLDTCPECGSPATLGEDTVESCCRDIHVVAVTCTDCESRLFEIEQYGQFDLG